MRMQRIPALTLLFSFLILSTRPLHAAAGVEGASFLDIPVGAGPAALGSAYTALANDAYAPVWNPGALAFVDTLQVAGQHLSYLQSINDEYLGLAVPLTADKRAVAVSAQYLGTGDITQTNASGFHVGNFDAHYGAYSLAYGQKLTDTVGVGVTGKWVNAKLGDVSANAYAADVGFLYKPMNRWRFAATMTNLGSKLTFIDQADSLPSAFHLAAAYQPNARWTVTGEAVHGGVTDRFDGRVGLEWTPIPLLSLRTGYRSDTLNGLSSLAGFSTGIGVHLYGSELAYAWLPYGDLGDTQYFSLLLRFGDHTRTSATLQKAQLYGGDADYEQLLELTAGDHS